ncbi:hypothetical protein SOCEGT47_051370 [Sorangium cellulosum]|uniref:Uncharacterized protein n=1 Tax=Sorangium cellulosum TaxID=56 RepID=A0A4P2Q693_SORCE|nr:hypothetical protein [Sorangium cellulosum]AUX24598.1 hypothetical protein SOCEGT47_051370 [Sorangium cellulosum]
MRERDLGSVRAVCGAGLIAVAAAGGCNAIIGLEVGELAPSEAGAGAASSSATSAAGGGGGAGAGGGGAGGDGAGGGGAGAGGDGAGGDGAGGGGAGAGGDGAGGDGAGAGGGGAGGGEEALCSQDREGAVRAPAGLWDRVVGTEVTDIEAQDDAVTALVNHRGALSVERWSAAGARDEGYGLTAGAALSGDVVGAHLSVGPDFAYVTGWSRIRVDLSLTPGKCPVEVASGGLNRAGFLAALDGRGHCRWVWSTEATSSATPLGLAATADRVVFAFSVEGLSVLSDRCAIGTDDMTVSTVVAAFSAEGECLWSHTLGAADAITVGEVVIDAENDLVLAVGDYDTSDAPVTIGGRRLSSQARDLFVARIGLDDGVAQDVLALERAGSQVSARQGAALLPGGDLVVAGTYSGSLDFEDVCAPMPEAASHANVFVARLSEAGVVWSRGFGDLTSDQLVASVAADPAGSIHVMGTFDGEIDLGPSGKLTNATGQIVSFLIVLDERGNVASAFALEGTGTTALWAAAPGAAPGAPLHIAGTMSRSLDLVPSAPDEDDAEHGFIVRLRGAP